MKFPRMFSTAFSGLKGQEVSREGRLFTKLKIVREKTLRQRNVFEDITVDKTPLKEESMERKVWSPS